MRILFILATVAMLSKLTDQQVALLNWMTTVLFTLDSPQSEQSLRSGMKSPRAVRYLQIWYAK